MKHTKEEIINALNVIKDECAGTNCRACPFGTYDEKCRLKAHTPSGWEIEPLPPATWRALK